jgi:hypothetical protein
MLACEPLDFCSDHLHFMVSVDVNVPNVSGRINNVPKYFVLESLDHSNAARFCAPP